MNFEKFCLDLESLDQQIIKTNKSFVITFTKSGGTAFNIDPEDIVLFLKFVSLNHSLCEDAIKTHTLFTKDSYTNYQEKPYRALYELAKQEESLKTISTLGLSQTKGLTQLISKFICYIAEISYVKIEENTYFDKESIDLALTKMPSDLTLLASVDGVKTESPKDLKLKFKKWLKKKKLSEKSISSYSGASISLADRLIKDEGSIFPPVYSITSVEKIESAIDWLQSRTEWKEKNQSGNNMFQAGINHYLSFVKEEGFTKNKVIINYTNLPKPFILLAGLSGTGKTRFVREQASTDGNNYCLAPVRPDWHEPSDLLGYVSRLNGKPEYVCTKVLNFIIRAWQVVAPDAGPQGFGTLNLSAQPYWLCLDEMNLAPVEQYFADYLSVLESRKFDDDGYFCEALLDKNLLQDLSGSGGNIQKELGLTEYDDLWKCFLNHGIPIPPNLIVAGTVNMDETTHGFSRKVIDRAFTFDFGEFFPNDYARFFEAETRPKTFGYSLITHASLDDLSATHDKDGTKTISFLTEVNSVLKQTPFELAYRALNELLLQVVCFKPASDAQLQAVWDDFLMAKVLPRIDGDEDKLRYNNGETSGNLLQILSELLKTQMNEIWNGNRHDFYREKVDGSAVDDISCRSKAKLLWMQNRLEVNTFTSFWP